VGFPLVHTILSVSPVAVAVVYFLILMVLYELIVSPLSYYRGLFTSPLRSINTKSRTRLADQAKGGAIGLLFGSAAVAVAYWLLSTLFRTIGGLWHGD
jgi:hypothetical protein